MLRIRNFALNLIDQKTDFTDTGFHNPQWHAATDKSLIAHGSETKEPKAL